MHCGFIWSPANIYAEEIIKIINKKHRVLLHYKYDYNKSLINQFRYLYNRPYTS